MHCLINIYIIILVLSLLYELTVTYNLISKEYLMQIYELEDCTSNSRFYGRDQGFADRYFHTCNKVLSKRHDWFVYQWFNEASKNVKWCMIDSNCQFIFSFRFLVILTVIFVLTQSISVFINILKSKKNHFLLM